MDASGNFWKSLGPGLIFAGAAVGVSHLVQSTRAGADFGLALLLFVLAACLFKYPAFCFGPYYAAATGTSLVEAYRRQSRWALWLFTALTFATMFSIQAAVTATTAGLAVVLTGGLLDTFWFSALLIASCALILGAGGFSWLNGLVRVMVAILTVCTLVATVLVFGHIEWGEVRWFPESFDRSTVFFIAALVGWMPSAVDIAVWHSMWTLARTEQTDHRPSPRESMLDFNVGYLGTALLAVCFVLMGAGVMHGRGVSFSDAAPAFAGQVIDLYASTLGEWSRPLLGTAAFFIMYSTMLTVVDGFPRVLSGLYRRVLTGPETPGEVFAKTPYWIGIAVIGPGSLAIIGLFPTSLKALVDLATTISFLTAPILAWLNHRAVFGPDLDPEQRPPRWLYWLSWAGFLFLTVFAAFYIWLRWLS